MLSGRTIWLAHNEGSGSNDADALAALEAAFAKAECRLGHRIRLPADAAPTARALAGGDIDLLVIFTGDGTIGSIVNRLYGWDGGVLVLPGGTMNLLSKRLHGDADAASIIARAASGEARRVRPPVVRTAHGDGLSGAVAGPATAWNEVREAMREASVAGFVGATAGAIAESRAGPMVACRAPAAGRAEGYAAITLTPGEHGIALAGYYADSLRDTLAHTAALARRNFRDGPHEDLGTHDHATLASVADAPIGLLLDGEPVAAGTRAEFALARCGVDLIATAEA